MQEGEGVSSGVVVSCDLEEAEGRSKAEEEATAGCERGKEGQLAAIDPAEEGRGRQLLQTCGSSSISASAPRPKERGCSNNYPPPDINRKSLPNHIARVKATTGSVYTAGESF